MIHVASNGQDRIAPAGPPSRPSPPGAASWGHKEAAALGQWLQNAASSAQHSLAVDIHALIRLASISRVLLQELDEHDPEFAPPELRNDVSQMLQRAEAEIDCRMRAGAGNGV